MSDVRDRIVAYARRAIGCRYSYVPSGGVEGESYNCSYLTTCAYRAAGLTIPRWQGHQNGDGSQSDWVWRSGHWTTDPDQLRPGDLVFFGTSRERTTHVGISLGGRWMIDSVPAGGVQTRLLYGSFVGGGWPLKSLPKEDATVAKYELIKVDRIVTVKNGVNIREQPSTKSGIVGWYDRGAKVVLDRITFHEGRVWGSYVGLTSGKRRFIALAGCTYCEVG
jgi:cell wall-associated NlpC family hydrolase